MKILATIQGDNIAPRFDLTTEVIIARVVRANLSGEPRTIILPAPGSDELCSLILSEGINLVICGGIEETHFQYLGWKKIQVIDRIIGPANLAIELAAKGKLRSGAVLRPLEERDDHHD